MSKGKIFIAFKKKLGKLEKIRRKKMKKPLTRASRKKRLPKHKKAKR